MDDLIFLLQQLNKTIEQQISAFNEFIVVLDQEEQSIAAYSFVDVERTFILKDQITQMSYSLEEKRLTLLKKICYFMAYDTRGLKVSLPVFKTVFKTYIENVKKLLSEDIISILEKLYANFNVISEDFKNTFVRASGKIYRNQLILKKVLKHVNLSLNLFQTEADSSMNYDSLGKTHNAFGSQNSVTSIRVTV
jgi:flagellar biosynthesis/type III secretory pathway chaperone